MTIERIIRIMAGAFILLSLALGIEGSPIFVSKWFLAFTAFVGFNLLQSGFTGSCRSGSCRSGSCRSGCGCCGCCGAAGLQPAGPR